jgi:hypothetical protein
MADTKFSDPKNDDPNKPVISIRDFLGLVPNGDPHDAKPGEAVHQINMIPGPKGELRVRLGAKVVKFDQA